jgi:adenine-specific DNA-methyltransferase
MESINNYMPLSNDWNIERLQTLKQLYPDWFTSEGSLNIDEVKKAVNPDSVNETERYEFRWFGKSQAKRNAFTPSDATLVYDEDRSVNPESSENLIIEGENLEVLKLLSGSYREKVKCIYIDPPYNTGKDFVYSDNFTQDKKGYWEDTEILENGVKIDTNTETDGRYHSNWLNMMYSRLLIARQLLREDGVIFISIDDNEVHHLRKLCDEVFGEENFVANVVWQKKYAATNDAKGFSATHDHIIVYQKSTDFERILLPRTEEQNKPYKNDDNDGKGLWRSDNLLVKSYSANAVYPMINPNTNIEHFPAEGSSWRASKETMVRWLSENRIYWGKDGMGAPQLKRYLNEVQDGKVPITWWPFEEVGHNDAASKELKALFGTKAPFDTPKPSTLIKRMLQISTKETDIILDFFGGSGTTGQAVMEYNKEDKGNRKFILVQIPEAIDEKSESFKAGYKKISDITIERNKRVIAKIEKELAENEKKKEGELALEKLAEPTTDLGFKVFKLQKSNFPRVDFAPNPDFNETENLELLKKYISDKESQLVNAFNKEELLTEILLKNNFTLNYTVVPQEQFTKNEILFVTDGVKETLICLDVSIAPETVSHFKAHTDTKFICLERALDTTTKYNLKHYLGDKFNAF